MALSYPRSTPCSRTMVLRPATHQSKLRGRAASNEAEVTYFPESHYTANRINHARSRRIRLIVPEHPVDHLKHLTGGSHHSHLTGLLPSQPTVKPSQVRLIPDVDVHRLGKRPPYLPAALPGYATVMNTTTTAPDNQHQASVAA